MHFFMCLCDCCVLAFPCFWKISNWTRPLILASNFAPSNFLILSPEFVSKTCCGFDQNVHICMHAHACARHVKSEFIGLQKVDTDAVKHAEFAELAAQAVGFAGEWFAHNWHHPQP